MILIDTSVWIDHLRSPIGALGGLLAGGLAVQHPYVTGELALGSFKDRAAVLSFFRALPQAVVASQSEFLAFVEVAQLQGTGTGFVDSHLLAACRLLPGTLLWSRDKKLEQWAAAMYLAWTPD